MPQCPTCGIQVSEQTSICPECGMEVTSAPAPPEAAATPTPAPPEAATPPNPTPPADPVALPPAPTVTTARITLRRAGALTQDSFPLGTRVTIGRFDPDTGPVDVDLGPLPESSYISRRHAEVWQDASGQWFIRDLGSRNGTFYRAAGQPQFQRVTGEQALADGDEIALGNARFEFRTA